jgi:hypothetical protein
MSLWLPLFARPLLLLLLQPTYFYCHESVHDFGLGSLTAWCTGVVRTW